jgi:Ricin-type beta-trefoil lectin domain-like
MGVKYYACAIFFCVALAVRSQTHAGGFEGPGRYVIVHVESRLALELDRVDHRGVILASPRQNDSQHWDIERAGPELFYIRSVENGRALDSSGPNGMVNCARFDGGVRQQWRLEAGKENSVLIVGRDGLGLEGGGRVRVVEQTGLVGQRFFLRRVMRRE